MKPVVYDAAVLIAGDRSERRTWAEHRIRLEAGVIPRTRSRRRAGKPLIEAGPDQTPPSGCEIVPFDEAAAHAAGSLLGKTRRRDVVDASVAVLSIRHGVDIVSDDPHDIQSLLSAARSKVSLLKA
jgi:hypothetical protein